jgi:hypothetical protein
MRVAMSMRRWRALAVLDALVVLPAHARDEGDARWVTTTLVVRGNVTAPLSLSVTDLAKFPVQHVVDR